MITDANGTIRWTNKILKELIGSSSDQLEGKAADGLEVIEVAEPFREVFPEAIRLGVWRGTGIWQLGDRSVYRVEKTITPLKDVENGTTHAAWVVSVKPQGPARLEKYLNIFSAVSEGVVLQNHAGKIEACNASAEQMLGLTASQMTGRTSIDPRWHAIHEDGSPFPGETHPAMVTLRTGEPQSDVVMGVHKPDGTLTWISINSRPLLHRGSQPYAVICTFVDITEKINAEAALKPLRTLFIQLSYGASFGEVLFEGDVAYDILYHKVNEAYGRLTSLHNVVGKKVSDVVPGIRQSNPEIFEIYGRVARGAPPAKFETYVPQLRLWLSISVHSPSRGRFVSILEDISEHKALETSLSCALYHYKTLFNSTSDGIFVHGLSADGTPGPYLEVNDLACRMLGYSREELLKMTVLDLLPVDVRPAVSRNAARIRMEGQLFWEGSILSKDGRSVPVEVNTRVFDFDGEPRFISAVRDVTDREEAERRYRQVFEGALEGIFRVSMEGKLLDANPSLARKLGYKDVAELLLEVTDTATQVWLDPAERQRVIALLTLNGAIRMYECQWKRRDGTPFWVSFNSRVIFGKEGQPLYKEGFVQDITRLKLAEQEQAAMKDRLLEVQKMESLGRLAGGISHEFNNLLTVINGRAELLLQSLGSTHPSRESAKQIMNAGERAAAVTRQLMAFARQQTFHPKPLLLNKAVESFLSMVQRFIDRNIEIATELDRSLGKVLVDADQVQQILMSLFLNAQDAMGNGGLLSFRTANVTVDSELASKIGPVIEPGHYVVLSLSDTGTGIDEDTLKRIFEPFFTTKQVGRGMGLGLALAYGMIRQNNGGVTVNSAVGVGTKFTIYFPRLEELPEKRNCDLVIV